VDRKSAGSCCMSSPPIGGISEDIALSGLPVLGTPAGNAYARRSPM
jgi:hypothetical protein